MTKRLKQLTVRIAPAQWVEVSRYAEQRGIGMSEAARLLFDTGLAAEFDYGMAPGFAALLQRQTEEICAYIDRKDSLMQDMIFDQMLESGDENV